MLLSLRCLTSCEFASLLCLHHGPTGTWTSQLAAQAEGPPGTSGGGVPGVQSSACWGRRSAAHSTVPGQPCPSGGRTAGVRPEVRQPAACSLMLMWTSLGKAGAVNVCQQPIWELPGLPTREGKAHRSHHSSASTACSTDGQRELGHCSTSRSQQLLLMQEPCPAASDFGWDLTKARGLGEAKAFSTACAAQACRSES